MIHGAETREDSPAADAIGASAATDPVPDQRGQRGGTEDKTGEADDNDETAQHTRHHSTSPAPAPAPETDRPPRRLRPHTLGDRHDTLSSHDRNTLGDDNHRIREEANTFIARGPPLEPFATPFDVGGVPFRSHPPPRPTGEEPEGSHTLKAAAGSASSDDDSDIQEPQADDADQGDTAPADSPKRTQSQQMDTWKLKKWVVARRSTTDFRQTSCACVWNCK